MKPKTREEVLIAIRQLEDALAGARHKKDREAGQAILTGIAALYWSIGDDRYGFGAMIADLVEVD